MSGKVVGVAKGGIVPDGDPAERFARESLQRSIRQDGNNAVFPLDPADAEPILPGRTPSDAAEGVGMSEDAPCPHSDCRFVAVDSDPAWLMGMHLANVHKESCGHASHVADCDGCRIPKAKDYVLDYIGPSLGDVPSTDLPAWRTYHAFVTAARALKQAEDAVVAARQQYAEAVKRLSEEAVR